jgi:phosphatidylcholine synthase
MPPRVAAYLVHIYTASGVILHLAAAALLLAPQPNFELSLALMMASILIDATDGFFARRADVKRRVPEVDGRRLDDVVDYVGYVFVPALFFIRAGLLPEPVVLWGSIPLLASAFGFSQVIAKLDDDGFFVGFPSYWNILAFYLYVLGLPPWANAAIITVLSVLVFVPTRYIYITRFPRYKLLNYILAYYWGATVMISLFVGSETRTRLLLSSLVFPIYYTVYSLWLDWQARRRPRPDTKIPLRSE